MFLAMLCYIPHMRYRQLGRTGYEVSEVGYGAWGIGGQLWVGANDSVSVRALHRAIDQGLNFIDTALSYGNGHSEKLVGAVLRDRSERICVATKVPPKNRIWPATGKVSEVFPSSHLSKCVDKSLVNLGLDRIDLIQLHVWDPSWLEEEYWYEELIRLKQQGKINYWGVCVTDHQPDSAIDLVLSGKVDTLQVIYNIFDQSPASGLFQVCADKKVGVIVRVPFDEGALTGNVGLTTKFPKRDWRNFYFRGDRKAQVQERVQKLLEFLDKETKSLPELSLKFCLSHPAVSTVIPGMRSVQHVEDNLAVSGQPPLPKAIVRKLYSCRWEKNFYR